MTTEVWNVATVKTLDNGWAAQAVAYEVSPRRDGLPIWQRSRELGEARSGSKEGNLAPEAIEDGVRSGLTRVIGIRHGGIALTISDLIPDKAEETRWRLGGVRYRLYYAFATKQAKRLIIALSKEVDAEIKDSAGRARKGHAWVLVKRVGSVTRKQLLELLSLGLEVKQASKIPRVVGKVVWEVVWEQ